MTTILVAYLLTFAPGAAASAPVPATSADSTTGPGTSATASSSPAASGAASGVVAGPTATDDVTWAVAPADDAQGSGRPHYVYTLAPGGTVQDALAVTNRGNAPITLRVYASDAITTSAGAIDLLPAVQRPTDVGAWITMRDDTITLAPQQSAVVPFTLTVPANATPGDHSGGVVTSLVTTPSGSGPVRVDRRLGSRIYLRVTGELRPALSVGEVHADYLGTLNPFAGGAATVSYTVTNTGNVRLAAHQKVSVTGLFGLLAASVALDDLPEILPGNSLTRTVEVPGVWPVTRLTAHVDVQPVASQDQPAVTVAVAGATTALWAWPFGQFVVLVVLVGLVLGWIWLRRRRRRSVDAAIAAAKAAAREEALAEVGSAPATSAAAGPVPDEQDPAMSSPADSSITADEG